MSGPHAAFRGMVFPLVASLPISGFLARPRKPVRVPGWVHFGMMDGIRANPVTMSTETQESLPRKLGKYVLKRELGRGATSIVYLADDPFFMREVAIKVVHVDAGDEASNQLADASLKTEAALLGRLNHPHIVKVFDVVDTGDEHYVVMELVSGGNMEAHCRRGSLLDYPKVIDAIFKCAKALEYMNSLGLIHRDIKPANILITETGDIRLSDLGATLLNTEGAQLDAGVGTPFYMSPEQLLSRPLEFRSDMFSLGVVFYELLTGEKPFDALNVDALIYQFLNCEPRAPSEMRPSLPHVVDRIVARMIGRLPSQRYPTWNECLADLAAVPLVARDADAAGGFATASERFRLLRDSKFFRSFSDADLWYVVELGSFHVLSESEILLREGDPGGFFYVILAGTVQISKAGRTIDEVGEGTSIGEISYVLDGRVHRNTTCTVIERGIALRVEDEILRRSSATCRSRFEWTFLQTMASWLVDQDSRLARAH